MGAKRKQSGLTLTELTVVVGGVAVLAYFGMPAIRTLFNSFESSGSTRAMISSAMASARAIAAKEQRYAGIRFQRRYDPCDPSGLNAAQYMIFILHDPDPNGTDRANGFRAVEGLKPIKLPDSAGVTDLMLGSDGDASIFDIGISEDWQLTDTTTFSIVFSPSGKLVIHDVRATNRRGTLRPQWPDLSGYDDIFNSIDNIERHNMGMFLEDDYPELGLGPEQYERPESSRNHFIIFDRNQFDKLETGERRLNYLGGCETVFINPYTGTIISAD